jgi:hypothetical protein
MLIPLLFFDYFFFFLIFSSSCIHMIPTGLGFKGRRKASGGETGDSPLR